MTNLMNRRRVLMTAGEKKKNVRLVDGTYLSTVTVTKGNHVNMNPLPFNKVVRIPLTAAVEISQLFGLKFSNSFVQNTAVFVYWTDGTRKQLQTGTNIPKGDTWYENAMSGTMESLGLYAGAYNNINDCDISLKIDGKVVF